MTANKNRNENFCFSWMLKYKIRDKTKTEKTKNFTSKFKEVEKINTSKSETEPNISKRL